MSRRVFVQAPWPCSQIELLPRARLTWGGCSGNIGLGFGWLNLWVHVWLWKGTDA